MYRVSHVEKRMMRGTSGSKLYGVEYDMGYGMVMGKLWRDRRHLHGKVYNTQCPVLQSMCGNIYTAQRVGSMSRRGRRR